MFSNDVKGGVVCMLKLPMQIVGFLVSKVLKDSCSSSRRTEVRDVGGLYTIINCICWLLFVINEAKSTSTPVRVHVCQVCRA